MSVAPNDYTSKVLTGAKVRFTLNGAVVAYATVADYTVSHEMVPIYGVDRLTPYEYAEVGYSCSFSVTRFRVPKKASAVGTGSPMSLDWQSAVKDLLTQGGMTAVFTGKSMSEDGTADVPVMTFVGVKMANRSGSMPARDVATERIDFVALYAYDEASTDAANHE